MPDNSTVIVNFSAVDSAINEYKTCATAINDLASELSAQASALSSAWKSSASEAYQGKMNNLKANFSKASETLNQRVNELTQALERERAAEEQARGIADSVNSINL